MINAILKVPKPDNEPVWEYRPGSTLYFVWTQERTGYDPSGDFDFGRARRNLFDQQPLNVFQIKATYWFGR